MKNIIKKVLAKLSNGLDWYGKHQKLAWCAGGVFIAIWAAYDTGTVVTKRSINEDEIPVTQGVITFEQLIKDADKNKSGRLYFDENNIVKYRDKDKKGWLVKDFKENISQAKWKELEKDNITSNGEFKQDITRKNLTSSEVTLTIILDLALKMGMFAFYMFIMYIFYKQLKQMKNGESNLNKSRFRIIDTKSLNVKIADVAGHEEAKKEVTEVVEYLKDPARFNKVGARPLKGVLLYGPPGNGKTMLAKAIAGEAQASFIEQEASSFVQIYVGSGPLAVKNLFKKAREMKPCVIFIDEIDALGGDRAGLNPSDERALTVNALLAEMDGFEDNTGIIVIAATNRMEELDPALIRPGRFDRKVKISLPNRNDRYSILKAHAKKLPKININFDKWADQTKGYSAAELAALMNESAIESSRSGKEIIEDAEVSMARDRITMGTRQTNMNSTERDKKFVAYHELGHAVIRIKEGGNIEKVSIQPRGNALGATISMYGQSDDVLQTPDEIFTELKVLMGGRAAEDVFCGAISVGAADDLARASQLSRESIRRYGFEGYGPYIPESETLKVKAEEKAAEWINKAYSESKTIMQENKAIIEELYSILIVKEELSGEIIKEAVEKSIK